MSTRLTTPSQGTPSAGISRVPYLPGLDGLRAIAVVAVMIYHAHHSWLPGGYLGVEVFFVISGYLITLLLIGEYERTKTIDLRQFWVRRFRRLLPALYLTMVIVASYMALSYTVSREESRGDFLGGIFYVANWYQIFVGQGYATSEAFVPLRHLWSLAVEEQFYIIWPLIMTVILRRSYKRLPELGLKLFMVAVAITVAVALVFVSGPIFQGLDGGPSHGYWNIAGHMINVNDALYLGTFSRAGGLMLGAAFATLWRPMAILRGPIKNKAGRVDMVAGVGLAIVLAMMATVFLTEKAGTVYNPLLYRGGFFLVGIASLMMIAGATHQKGRFGDLMGNTVFLWIGTRSYGLYLFHWPVYQFIRKQADIEMSPAQLLLAMAITLPLTELSYRFVETPIRAGRLGNVRKMLVASGAHVMMTVSLVAMVGVTVYSMTSAEPHCVGEVRCSLTAGGTDDDTETTDTETTAPETTDPGTTDPDASTTSTTGAVVAAKKYVAIGESVMEGAFVWLEGSGISTFAKEGRGPEGAKNAMIKYRDQGFIGAGTQVVVQVGHNAPMDQASIDAIMAEVPEGAGTIWFMNLNGDAAWIDDNNTLIEAIPAAYPNAQLIDWHEAAKGLTLCSDGMHLTCGGDAAIIAYTNLILTALGLPTV